MRGTRFERAHPLRDKALNLAHLARLCHPRNMSVSLLEGFCNFVQLLLKHVSSLLHNFLAGQLPPWLNVKDETVRIVFHFNQIVADAVTGIDQGRGAYQVPVYLPVFSEYLRRILVTKLSKFFRIVMDSYLRKICIVH